VRKHNEIQVNGKYQIEVSDDSLDIKGMWESIRDNIKTTTKENEGH
jgi:hypothetical protein